MRSGSAQRLIDRLAELVAAALGREPKPVPVRIPVRVDDRANHLQRPGDR